MQATIRQAKAAAAEARGGSAASHQAPRDIPLSAPAQPGAPVATPRVLVLRPPREDEAARGRARLGSLPAAALVTRSTSPRAPVPPNDHLQDDE